MAPKLSITSRALSICSPQAGRSEARAWRLAQQAPLLFRAHADGVVLFNRLSGDTHLITPEALHLLQLLESHPGQQAHQLLAVLDPETAASDPQAGLDALQILLDELTALDLIES